MKRRDFIRTAGLAAAATALPIAPNPAAQTTGAGGTGKRPNIILIMADDMGYSDIGCFGGEIETPNIDRLASNGLRFTQFYNTSRCCPTRASLLTGLYAHQAGIGHMTVEEPHQGYDYGYPSYRGSLNENCVTIAEALKPAGYNTYMSGKWHVGTFEGMWPVDRGFDEYFGIIRGACNFWKPEPKRLLLHNRERIRPDEDFYTTDDFTDYALDFVDDASDKEDPFFLYLSYNAPHWPLHAHDEDVAKYRGKYKKGWDAIRKERYERMIEMGLVQDQWELSAQDSPVWEDVPEEEIDTLDHRMAIYAAQIDRMDQNIGRLLKKLEDVGELDNTLILFFVDNGACAEGDDDPFGSGPKEQLGTKEGYFLTYGGCWANASNTPYRYYKHYVHEGGIASPLIAHWPEQIKDHGTLRHEPTHLIDLMPTVLDLAGAEYPTEYNGNVIPPVEGVSMLPVFDDRPLDREALYFEHEGNRAVRMGKWKLVAAHREPWRLYHMENDRTETNDLSDDLPDLRAKMIALYDIWANRCGVLPWPVRRKPGFEPPERVMPKTWVDLGL